MHTLHSQPVPCRAAHRLLPLAAAIALALSGPARAATEPGGLPNEKTVFTSGIQLDFTDEQVWDIPSVSNSLRYTATWNTSGSTGFGGVERTDVGDYGAEATLYGATDGEIGIVNTAEWYAPLVSGHYSLANDTSVVKLADGVSYRFDTGAGTATTDMTVAPADFLIKSDFIFDFAVSAGVRGEVCFVDCAGFGSSTNIVNFSVDKTVPLVEITPDSYYDIRDLFPDLEAGFSTDMINYANNFDNSALHAAGTLATTTASDDQPGAFTVGFDLDGIASLIPGVPPLGVNFDLSFSALGKDWDIASLSADLLDADLNQDLGVSQSYSLTPTAYVTYTFDQTVYVTHDSVTLATDFITVEPGESFTLSPLGPTQDLSQLVVTASYGLDANVTSSIAIYPSDLYLTLAVLQIQGDILGAGVNFGPLYSDSFTLGDFSDNVLLSVTRSSALSGIGTQQILSGQDGAIQITRDGAWAILEDQRWSAAPVSLVNGPGATLGATAADGLDGWSEPYRSADGGHGGLAMVLAVSGSAQPVSVDNAGTLEAVGGNGANGTVSGLDGFIGDGGNGGDATVIAAAGLAGPLQFNNSGSAAALAGDAGLAGGAGAVDGTPGDARVVDLRGATGPALIVNQATGGMAAVGGGTTGATAGGSGIVIDGSTATGDITVDNAGLMQARAGTGGGGTGTAAVILTGGGGDTVHNHGILDAGAGNLAIGTGAGDDGVTLFGNSVTLGDIDTGADTDWLALDGAGAYGGRFSNLELLRKTGPGIWALTGTDAGGADLVQVAGGVLQLGDGLNGMMITAGSTAALAGTGLDVTALATLYTGGLAVHDGAWLTGNGTVSLTSGSVGILGGGALRHRTVADRLTVAGGDVLFSQDSTFTAWIDNDLNDSELLLAGGGIGFTGATTLDIAPDGYYAITYTPKVHILASGAATVTGLDNLAPVFRLLPENLISSATPTARLRYDLSTDGTNVVLTNYRVPFEDAVLPGILTTSELAVAGVLSDTRPGDMDYAMGGLADYLDHLETLQSDTLTEELRNLNPEPLATHANIAWSVSRAFEHMVRRHMDTGRGSWGTANPVALAARFDAPRPARGLAAMAANAAGARNAGAGRALWVDAYGDSGDQNRRGDRLGYEFDTTGTAFGLDVPAGDWQVGGAVGYAASDTDYDRGQSDAEATTWSAGLYASRGARDHYLSGMLSLHTGDHELTRDLGAAGTARSNTRSTQAGLSLEAGLPRQAGDWTVTPLAGLQYDWIHVDDYREKGSLANMEVDDLYARSLSSRLGVKAETDLDERWTARLRGEWQHEFLDNTRTIGIGFIEAPDIPVFGIDAVEQSRDSLLLGMSLGYTRDSLTLGFDADVETRDAYVGYLLGAGVNYRF